MSKEVYLSPNLHSPVTATPRPSLLSSKSTKDGKNKLHSYLTSLQNMQTLKRDSKLHSLPYSQLNQFCVTPNQSEPSIHINGKPKLPQSSPKEEYLSLDPLFLRERVPQKQRKLHVPTEKRQLLLNQQKDPILTGKQSFDSIWHQTLSARSTVGNLNSFEKEDVRYSVNMNSTERSRTDFFSMSQRDGTEGLAAAEPKSFRDGSNNREESPEERGTATRGLTRTKEKYLAVKKDIKVIEDLEKDFTKIVSYTQKSYQKAEEQQKELYNFASAFAVEIAELEKFPKESKVSRLKNCLQSIQTKINELNWQEELVKEQICYINELMSSEQASNKSIYIPLDRVDKLKDKYFMGTSTDRPASARVSKLNFEGSIKREAELSHREKDRCMMTTTSEDFDRVKMKTHELKLDVKKLQEERLEFFMCFRKERTGSIKIRTVKSPRALKKWEYGVQVHSPNGTNQEYQLLSKQNLPFNSLGLSSHSGTSSFGNPTPLPQDQSTPMRRLNLVGQTEGDGGNGENVFCWTSTVELYSMFKCLLNGLEETLRREIGSIKALKKDVDDESEGCDEHEITGQVEQAYRRVSEEMQKYVENVKRQRSHFLYEVANHFMGLVNLNKSNLLKLESLKNIIEASIDKIIAIRSFISKFSAKDLEDKMVRQQYDKKYNTLKGELKEFHKTLMFLADQLNLPVSVYRLHPIHNLPLQDLMELKSQFETVSKVLYYLHTLPELEEEYNEKTTKAYRTIKKARDTREALEVSIQEHEVGSAKKVREGEEPIGVLKNLIVRVASLRNKLEIMSRVRILRDLVEKPLVVAVKLMKQMEMNEKSLEKILNSLLEKITNRYNELMSRSQEVENQVTAHTKRLLVMKEHLGFSEWTQNSLIMETLKVEITEIDKQVCQYVKEDYPLRVPLVPRPQQKKEEIEFSKKRVEVVLKILATGNMFAKEDFHSLFSDIKSYNMREKLGNLYDSIQNDIEYKEKIMSEIHEEDELTRRMVIESLQFLTKFRFILKKAFELQDKLSMEYLSFQGERIEDDPYLQNPTRVLEENQGVFPRLLLVSNNNFDNRGIEQSGAVLTQSLVIEEDYDRASPELRKKAIEGSACALPVIHNPEHTLSKIDIFITRLKKLFKEYIEDHMSPQKSDPFLFKEIYDCFNAMRLKELEGLEKLRNAVNSAQVHQIFFNKEVKPLTKLYKCIRTLPMWNEKMESLLIVKHNMIDNLTTLKGFEGDESIRRGFNSQIVQYRQAQEIVTTSMDMITEILSLGRIFTEKEFAPYLSKNIRVEETAMHAYLNLLDRNVDKLVEMYHKNSMYIEQETTLLTSKFSEFMRSLVRLARLTQTSYIKVLCKMADGPKLQQGGFTQYLQDIYTDMKDLTDIFCDNVNIIAKMTAKPTWVVRLLDEFYKEIILKDLNVLANLWNVGKEIEEFIKDFKENFIEIEVKQRAQYRKIAESNPSKCDLRVEKATELSSSLNFLTHSEELMYRPQLRQILSSKNKSLKAVKNVYSNFALIYSMGRKLSDKVDDVIVGKDIKLILHRIPEIEAMLQDMIKHLQKVVVETSKVSKDKEANVGINLTEIIKDEILDFYIEFNAWFDHLKLGLKKNVQFYSDLKRTFEGEILFLRNDWISFIRDWLSNSATDITIDVNKIPSNYQDYKDRLGGYAKEIQKSLAVQQSTLKEIVCGVQYLNENFFHEWFFEVSVEKRSGDIVLTRITKLVEKIKSGQFPPDYIMEKARKIADSIDNCDKCLRYLAVEEANPVLFDGGIKGWNLIQNYYKTKNIRGWLSILLFTDSKILVQLRDEREKIAFREKVQTIDGLYIYTEQITKCSLNNAQKEFLAVVYHWVNRVLYGTD